MQDGNTKTTSYQYLVFNNNLRLRIGEEDFGERELCFEYRLTPKDSFKQYQQPEDYDLRGKDARSAVFTRANDVVFGLKILIREPIEEIDFKQKRTELERMLGIEPGVCD